MGRRFWKSFQRLPHFPRKMVLHSSTKFGILKPWTIISKLIRFDLGFWQTLKQIYRKFKYRDKVLKEFQRFPSFPKKMVLYSSTIFGILKPWPIISKLIRFDLGFWQTSKKIYRKLKYREKVFQEFQRLSYQRLSFLRLFWNLMSCVTNRSSGTCCADVFNTFIGPLINAFTKDFLCFPRCPIDIETYIKFISSALWTTFSTILR